MPDGAGAPAVDLHGKGRLHDALLDRLGPPAPPGRRPALLVVAADTRVDDLVGPERALAATRGVPLLVVRAHLGHVVLGPLEEPGAAGCVDCASHRERRAHEHRAGVERLLAAHAVRLATAPSPWLTDDAARVAAEIVAEDVAALAAGGAARTRGTVVRIALDTLAVRGHALLPDPRCDTCGALPDDTADAARVPDGPLPKPSPAGYRLRDLRDERERLLRTYVDDSYGLIRRVARQSSAALALSSAPMGLRDSPATETGFGRGPDYDGTDLTAVLEALERHGGMSPGGRRGRVRGSYRDLAADALDPTTLGTHAPEQHAAAGFPYDPFDPDRELRWVWGYSLTERRPVLVPRAYAYYGLPHAERHGETSVYEISNGCALGGSLVEAALHGLLEGVERDAFLLTWHARLALPEVDARSCPDPAVGLLAARLAHTSGYAVRLFDATMEHGVPAVWAVAVNESGDDRAATVSAAGAHPRAAAAAFAALCELGPMLESVNQRFPGERDRAGRMAEDPGLVRVMADHALLHAHPAARDRLDFLLAPGRVREFDAAFCPADRVIGTSDLTADLAAFVARFADLGLPVVVVDQTTDEHRATGLHCVKTIVPGLLPMTFGHRFRRLDRLPRLRSVPAALGFGAATVTADPHPFP